MKSPRAGSAKMEIGLREGKEGRMEKYLKSLVWSAKLGTLCFSSKSFLLLGLGREGRTARREGESEMEKRWEMGWKP